LKETLFIVDPQQTTIDCSCGISEIWLTLRIENGGKGNWWERCRSLLYQKEKD
jgi:hypothetical protein